VDLSAGLAAVNRGTILLKLQAHIACAGGVGGGGGVGDGVGAGIIQGKRVSAGSVGNGAAFLHLIGIKISRIASRGKILGTGIGGVQGIQRSGGAGRSGRTGGAFRTSCAGSTGRSGGTSGTFGTSSAGSAGRSGGTGGTF